MRKWVILSRYFTVQKGGCKVGRHFACKELSRNKRFRTHRKGRISVRIRRKRGGWKAGGCSVNLNMRRPSTLPCDSRGGREGVLYGERGKYEWNPNGVLKGEDFWYFLKSRDLSSKGACRGALTRVGGGMQEKMQQEEYCKVGRR